MYKKKQHLLLASFALIAAAQAQTDSVTYQDYQRAESFLGYRTIPLVKNANILSPSWNGSELSFGLTENGQTHFYNIDAKTGKKTSIITASKSITSYKNAAISPDGKSEAFIKNNNLWLRNLTTKEESQLTFDGSQYYGYATDNAGWTNSENPILIWSPDGTKIATFQQDERRVGDMYLVTTNVGHPKLKAWKYPLPGDSAVAMIERVIIDVPSKKMTRLDIAPSFHRGTLSDDVASSGIWDDVKWSSDSKTLAFVSTSRDHKSEDFYIADAMTGAVKKIFNETVKTQFESGQGVVNWYYLNASNEIIWYSERDNWGHLYLYNATTGKLKNQITKGDWLVTRLLHIDEKNRTLYFMSAGREAKNPYFQQLCSVKFDGTKDQILTPEEGNHTISFSPDKAYFVDNYSQPDVAPVTTLRTIAGKKVADLAAADLSALKARGWKAPTPLKLKAADGVTDVYGLLFTPTKMDATQKYPIIDYIYPGPQGGSVGNWSFGSARNDNQSLAELGSIVLVLEGTSNPLRSKSFHDMSYGNMAMNTLPDQISAIRQLAKTYPIDTTKIGIWGHSGGGFATAGAMFRYPDFFKVGISESGNHENLNYEDDWGERYNGLVENADYAKQANPALAHNLKGKLMLVTGMMDNNVPPYNTLLVVDALNKANKDYDLVVFPNSPHGYGSFSYYMMCRRWDYFVTNLFDKKHPKEYLLGVKK